MECLIPHFYLTSMRITVVRAQRGDVIERMTSGMKTCSPQLSHKQRRCIHTRMDPPPMANNSHPHIYHRRSHLSGLDIMMMIPRHPHPTDTMTTTGLPTGGRKSSWPL